ncbi:alpha/beta hydrolase [Flavobacterium hauense]
MKNQSNLETGRTFAMPKLYGEFNTQQEIDAEYDVEKAVADFSEYIDHFIKASEETRNVLKNRIVIKYGPTTMERLTVYPSRTPDAPVLVFLHGGYWKLGLGDDYDFVAMGPSLAHFTVVIVTYALAPNVNIPEIIRQVRSSVYWTAKNIAVHNGNPDAIFVAGHSAGGHLAAMTGLTNWNDYGLPDDCIKGILAISGLYDLEPVSQTFVQPAIRITAEHILNASPIRLIRQSNIPLIIAWGALETNAFKKQSSDFLQAWQNAGNNGSFLIVSEANHFNILEGFQTEKGFLTNALLSLAATI